ncbi:MAG: hypothetical protein WKG03_08285 [Telluria sp.]
MKRMRCEIVIARTERRKHQEMAGKVAVGLVSLAALGHEVATWYLLSHGVTPDTVLRVITKPHKRRR